MSRVAYDLVATIIETDKQGNERKRYQKCGVVFETSRGLSAKLECVPVGAGWNGWLSLYEPKARDTEPQQRTKRSDDDPPF